MIRPVVWAKMEGIVFGATKKDAHSFSKNLQNKNLHGDKLIFPQDI